MAIEVSVGRPRTVLWSDGFTNAGGLGPASAVDASPLDASPGPPSGATSLAELPEHAAAMAPKLTATSE